MYYGLDWVAFITGLSGAYLITKKSYWGFALSGLCCFAGFAVAALSYQFGFIAYNLVLMTIMAKGFMDWAGEDSRIRSR
jgi:hypothetical protein